MVDCMTSLFTVSLLASLSSFYLSTLANSLVLFINEDLLQKEQMEVSFFACHKFHPYICLFSAFITFFAPVISLPITFTSPPLHPSMQVLISRVEQLSYRARVSSYKYGTPASHSYKHSNPMFFLLLFLSLLPPALSPLLPLQGHSWTRKISDCHTTILSWCPGKSTVLNCYYTPLSWSLVNMLLSTCPRVLFLYMTSHMRGHVITSQDGCSGKLRG